MKPIKFNEQNVIYTGPKGSGIAPLAAYQDNQCIISCFKMSFRERLFAVVFGRLWLYTMAQQMPPVRMLCASTAFKQLAWWKRCIFCGGTGYVPGSRQYKGKGINIKRDCPHCEGSGFNWIRRSLPLTWPAWTWGILGAAMGLVACVAAV